MMSTGWNWFVIIVTLANILACWWLIVWATKNKANESKEGDVTGHVWDEDLQELNNPLPRWWLYLFYFTIIFGLGYLALYPGLGNFKGLLSWTGVSQYNEEAREVHEAQKALFAPLAKLSTEELIKNEQALLTGSRLFAANCAACHGSDARGARGFPNLTDDDWLYAGDYDSLVTTITYGRTGVMPAWQSALNDDGVQEVTAFVRQLSGQQADPQLAAKGEARYNMYCVACHGPGGEGNPAMGAPNLANNIWLYGGSEAAIAHSISVGRMGNMPAQKDFLTEERIRLIAAYVSSLAK
ncbi:MAG: cytochrome-c oxidase, cbb3-type subunit III [Xanthomonadales bacterium]|nr:cytochrome-c oxidase, cbb3-type subunit III [Xanthomonadales bacterium]